MPIYRRVNKDFFKTWSPEMAYVLGFFAADGNMICGPRGNHYISFHSTDKELLIQIRKALKSNHKLAIHKFPLSDKTMHWKTQYQIQIGSKDMFADLLKLGMIPQKSLKMKFPQIPKRFVGDFVRGYFDGDGCIYFRKHNFRDRKNERWVFQTKFISGNSVFLGGLHRVLKPHVAGGFIVEKNRGFELCFSHLDSLALYKFMYNNVSNSLYLERKYRLFRKAVNTLYVV